MSIESEIHPVQAKILKILLFKPEGRFSELNQTDLTNDHFTFHLNQLLIQKLVEKTPNSKYQLTLKWKEFANRLDTEKVQIERQAKISVLIVGVKQDKNQSRYLFQQRLKQPYFGFYGFVSGKVRWGETAEEAARREFKEETRLTAKLRFCGIEHKMDYSLEGNLLEDKFFFIFEATALKGRLIEKFEGGKNLWVGKKEIKTMTNLFKDVGQIIKTIRGGSPALFENKFTEEIY